jgi:hypothetical protein
LVVAYVNVVYYRCNDTFVDDLKLIDPFPEPDWPELKPVVVNPVKRMGPKVSGRFN